MGREGVAGDAVYVDYTLDAAAHWWGGLFRAYTDHGVAGIWTDMNEPSDFIDQTGKTQMDVVTYDNGRIRPMPRTGICLRWAWPAPPTKDC